MLSPFECLCGNFILPEPANYVFFYAIFNLRNLLDLIEQHKLERLENQKKYLEQCVQAAISTETKKDYAAQRGRDASEQRRA